jgi:hypothetical protein
MCTGTGYSVYSTVCNVINMKPFAMHKVNMTFDTCFLCKKANNNIREYIFISRNSWRKKIMSEEEGDIEKFFIGFDFSTQQVRSSSFKSLKLTELEVQGSNQYLW